MKRLLPVFIMGLLILACTDSSRVVSKSAQAIPSAGHTFSIGRKAVQLLPYPMRISKLRHVLGGYDAALFQALEERKDELGAFDHARGVGQELSWQETRMLLWTKSIQPICASEKMFSRYPWTSGLHRLAFATFGREYSSAEQQMISRVESLSLTPREKFEVFCISLLSSLEFLSL